MPPSRRGKLGRHDPQRELECLEGIDPVRGALAALAADQYLIWTCPIATRGIRIADWSPNPDDDPHPSGATAIKAIVAFGNYGPERRGDGRIHCYLLWWICLGRARILVWSTAGRELQTALVWRDRHP